MRARRSCGGASFDVCLGSNFIKRFARHIDCECKSFHEFYIRFYIWSEKTYALHPIFVLGSNVNVPVGRWITKSGAEIRHLHISYYTYTTAHYDNNTAHAAQLAFWNNIIAVIIKAVPPSQARSINNVSRLAS